MDDRVSELNKSLQKMQPAAEKYANVLYSTQVSARCAPSAPTLRASSAPSRVASPAVAKAKVLMLHFGKYAAAAGAHLMPRGLDGRLGSRRPRVGSTAPRGEHNMTKVITHLIELLLPRLRDMHLHTSGS